MVGMAAILLNHEPETKGQETKKSRPLRGRLWAAWLAKSSGEEGKVVVIPSKRFLRREGPGRGARSVAFFATQ